jgi:hypothetical protein
MYTLDQIQALNAAARTALDTLAPERDKYQHGTPEYWAVNQLMNAAVDQAAAASREWVDAHIVPAPTNPTALARITVTVAADLNDPAHVEWDLSYTDVDPVILTGRTYVAVDGAVWYEAADGDELNAPNWYSADVPVDPRGFSSKWEVCPYESREYML